MKKTVAALAACTLAFAACGDDDESPSGDTGAETETTDADTESTEADDTESTEADDTGSTEADDTESTEAGESEGSVPGGAEEMLDQARRSLTEIGLSEEQADCVIDQAFESGATTGEMPSMDQVQEFYEDCGVDLGDLGG